MYNEEEMMNIKPPDPNTPYAVREQMYYNILKNNPVFANKADWEILDYIRNLSVTRAGIDGIYGDAFFIEKTPKEYRRGDYNGPILCNSQTGEEVELGLDNYG